jgi:hypothetical protein
LEPLGRALGAFIDQLPTEALFRGNTINIRIGEMPMTRQLLLAGTDYTQGTEALIKAEDCRTAPLNGERLNIAGTVYKILGVTALGPYSDPFAYRVTISNA